MSDNYAYLGAEDRFSSSTHINALQFMMERVVNRMSTCTLGQVQKVSNTPGEVTSVGTVDILPLVNLLDGYGQATQHQIVHGMPYFRFAGGQNAVLLDPQVGDIGLVIFADRDISSVKSNAAQSNPGSKRRFDMADGIYIGICLAQPNPNQFIAFTNNGITIQDKNGNKIVMSSSGIDCTAARLTCNNNITAGFGGGDSVTLQNHLHSGVQSGGGDTAKPVAGT